MERKQELIAQCNFRRVIRRAAAPSILSILTVVCVFALTCRVGSANSMQQALAPDSPQKETGPKLLSPHSDLSEAVKNILDSSRNVTPELHALALLLLVESNQKIDRKST